MTHEEAVARHMEAQLAVLTYGENCRVGPPRPPSTNQTVAGAVPEECVFCLGSGGFSDIPFVDAGNGGGLLYPTVQVIIRSGTKKYESGKDLADQAWATLDKNPPAGYIEARATSSQPLFRAEDETDHYMWSINVTLTLCV